MSVLAPAGTAGFRWNFTNQATPSVTPGTSVVPGASNVEGSWTGIATTSDIAETVSGIQFFISGGNTTATSKMHLMDIGVDPAGGTSYTARVSNLQVGSSGNWNNSMGLRFYVPLSIPAASSVAVRIQGNQATAGTVFVLAKFLGRPNRPEFAQRLTHSETIGTVTTSRGVPVTPGTSAAEGTWTLIGATTFPWRYILPSFQIDDGTIAADQSIWLDVAHGDGSNKTVVIENIAYFAQASETLVGGPGNDPQCWCDIKSGSDIYARLSTSAAVAESNLSVLVTGLG